MFANPKIAPILDVDSVMELESVLDSELKKKKTVEGEVDMEAEIWSRIPEDLLMMVLSALPTLVSVRFRAVCKRWRYLLSPAEIFQRISSLAVPCFIPGFLIGGQHLPSVISVWSHEEHKNKIRRVNSILDDLYLIQSLPNSGMYKLSLDFLGPDIVNVVTVCKSILCCYKERAPTMFYICNPVIKTWVKINPPGGFKLIPEFVGFGLRVCNRGFMLAIGTCLKREKSLLIYDSESLAWTKLEIDNPTSIHPSGEGVYSRGKFYWINKIKPRVRHSRQFVFDVVAFDVAERRWSIIGKPNAPHAPQFDTHCYWKLTGYEGHVVLVYSKTLQLWKLNEDEEEEMYRWSELQAFPRSLYQEAVNGGNIVINPRRRPRASAETCYCPQVVVNSCGWVLVYLPWNKLVVFDGQGRMMQNIEGGLLSIFERSYPLPLYPYEINNFWWPS